VRGEDELASEPDRGLIGGPQKKKRSAHAEWASPLPERLPETLTRSVVAVVVVAVVPVDLAANLPWHEFHRMNVCVRLSGTDQREDLGKFTGRGRGGTRDAVLREALDVLGRQRT